MTPTHDHGSLTPRSAAVEQVCAVREEILLSRRTETVGLDELTRRTAANPITATEDVPAVDHATMDGYAFDATAEYPLTIVPEEIFPEDEPAALEAGQAAEIATGAPLPQNANAVLKRELAEVDGDQLRGRPIDPGTYTYERGSNVRAGERLVAEGERLSPKDAILLRDLGHETVEVVEQLSVGVLATGTEIHEGMSPDLDSPMLSGLVRSWGQNATYEGTVPDESNRVKAAIADLSNQHDVVVTTGGTSVGHKDYVVKALDELGTVQFHGVSVRPGKPVAFATLPDTVVFAIPGKPVGAHLISLLVMRPFFTGEIELPTVQATFATSLDLGPAGFEYAVPVNVDAGEAMPLGHVDSPLAVYDAVFDPSVVSSSTRATRADGFVLTESPIEEDETVEVVPYSAVE